MTDNLYTGLQARERLISGIRKCASAVGATMGSAGSNAILQCVERPGYLLTNDGISILRAMKLADPIEDMGREILLDAVERANKQSGDGSSTATVLTASIIEEGMKYVESSAVMDIKRSLEECVALIEASIHKQKREITVNDVGKVAAISAEDNEIGNTIQTIYKEIGKDGIIHWDISKTATDSYTIGTGITIEGAGYLSPYMCDIDEKTQQFLPSARWKKPKVLLVRQKITSAAEFNDLFQTLFNQEVKEIVVFCDEIEAPVISDLIKTRAVRGFKTMVVKMPVLWKDQWYEDLSLATGAKIIDPQLGTSLKTMKVDDLGWAGNIVVTKEDTFVDGIKDLSSHIDKLEAEGSDESKNRAARLNTKTARYFVGAPSESALSYRRLKVEDAISAAWQALHGGIVAGGGVAMVNCANDLPNTVGGQILKKALLSPLKQIMQNARIKDGIEHCGGTKGFDSRSGKLVDMFESDIVNPANVEINACKNAVSVAATALSANTVTTIPRPEVPQMQYPVQL